MMVLVFYVQDPAAAEGLNGMPLVQMAVNNSVGPMGIHFITFAIFMFAYSTSSATTSTPRATSASSRTTPRRR